MQGAIRGQQHGDAGVDVLISVGVVGALKAQLGVWVWAQGLQEV